MDTTTPTGFDFTAELWQFVKSRFAFQAKQLKRLTGQPISQCYEIVGIGHGFSGWRGMSKVLDAMCCIDRLAPMDDWDDGTALESVRLSLAVGDGIEEIHDEDEGIRWKLLEQQLSRSFSARDHDDFDVFAGLEACHALRASLFYKAAWMGQGAPWSDGLIDEAFTCLENLEALWDGDVYKALRAVEAMYGADPCENGNIWDISPVQMAEYNSEVDRILSHGGATSPILSDAARAYRFAKSDGNLDIGGWRARLGEVHPGSLDRCWDQSFTPSLLLANAPHDAWVSIGLVTHEEQDRFLGPVHVFLPDTWAYAPSPQKAAQLGACLESVPTISRLTTDEARVAGLPIGDADWHLVETL